MSLHDPCVCVCVCVCVFMCGQVSSKRVCCVNKFENFNDPLHLMFPHYRTMYVDPIYQLTEITSTPVNKRFTWTVFFKRFTHPRVVIDVLADEWVEEFTSVSVKLFVSKVCAGAVIDTLSVMYVDVTIDVVSDTIAEVLADMNSNVLLSTMAV